MSKKEREFLDALRAASVEGIAEVMEGLQRWKQLQQEIVGDEVGVPSPAFRLGDQFYQLARFELEHATNLFRVGNAQANVLFDQARRLVRRKQGTSTPVVELLPAEDGSGYVGTFDIRNPFDIDADVRFDVPRLRTATGRKTDCRVDASCGSNNRVIVHHAGHVRLTLTGSVEETLFGEVSVYLSADVEQQVAHRLLKVRSTPPSPEQSAHR